MIRAAVGFALFGSLATVGSLGAQETMGIVDLINANFVAVWESVAPVKTATFDLGNGRFQSVVMKIFLVAFCVVWVSVSWQ